MTTELRLESGSSDRPIALIITPITGTAVRTNLNRTRAVELAVELIALAAIAAPLEPAAAYETLGNRLRGIVIRLKAVADTADIELGVEPAKPDEHAPDRIEGPHPSSGAYAGVCRCGHYTPPLRRASTARGALCQHVLNPEGDTP